MDRYRLSAITGLDDADVRDTREPNPDYDGETPFGSLYGGRTITLTGEVQAGNLDYLRYMQHHLKIAFDDLSVERELLIRWHDWYDDFFADTTAGWMKDYVSLANVGSEGVAIDSSGRLTCGTTQFKFVALARQYENYQTTLKFHTGSTVSGVSIWLFGKWVSNTEHMLMEVTSTALNIYQHSPSSAGVLRVPTVPFGLAPDTDYWVRMRQDGIFLHAQVFTEDPDHPAGVFPVTETLVGVTDHGEMGVGAVGRNGFGAQIGTPVGWYFDSLDIRSLSPGDMMIRCKKIAKMEGAEGWTGLNYKLPFMLTLRASSPLKQSRQETTLPMFGQAAQVKTTTLTFPANGRASHSTRGRDLLRRADRHRQEPGVRSRISHRSPGRAAEQPRDREHEEWQARVDRWVDCRGYVHRRRFSQSNCRGSEREQPLRTSAFRK